MKTKSLGCRNRWFFKTYFHGSFCLTTVHGTTPDTHFSHSRQENVKWADLKTSTTALNTSGWCILLNESRDEYKSWRALYKIAYPDCSISYAQCNVSFLLHYRLQETKEVNKSSLNIYQNIVYRLHRRRQKSAKAAVDIRVVAKPEYKFGQSILSHSICNKALLIVVPGGVKSATNRKASRGSSEKVLIILLSSSWLLIAGYFREPRINWALQRSAYYLPIEGYFWGSGIQ